MYYIHSKVSKSTRALFKTYGCQKRASHHGLRKPMMFVLPDANYVPNLSVASMGVKALEAHARGGMHRQRQLCIDLRDAILVQFAK